MKYLDALLDGTWEKRKKHSDTEENEPPKPAKPIKTGVMPVLQVHFPMNTEKQNPIETLDAFWSQDILPRLSRLHLAGRLPDLSMCPLWNEVDRLWQEKPLNAGQVERAMMAAVEVYERQHI